MGYSIEVDGTNFDSEVIEKSYLNTVILDFYALWCGPCKLVKPMLEKLASEYNFILAKIDIDKNLLRGIFAYGFENPSPIQQKAILPLIKGRDVIAQAQSGTGKTAAFSIGALSKIDVNLNETQVIILSPTRELTMQTAAVVKGLGIMIEGLRVKSIFGGSSYEDTGSFLKRTEPHIICGCPGRVYDLIRREKISARNVKMVILDEADEMLSSGFKDQVYNIFTNFNENIQVALFSATIPSHSYSIIDKIMRDPVKIIVKNEMLTLEGISQFYVAVDDDRQKYATLKHIFSFISMSQCIIFQEFSSFHMVTF
jgi:superfamily II DNA/RNA helicase